MHTPEQIIAAVAAVTGIPVAQITGRRRTPSIVYARTLAVKMIHEVKTWWSQKQIAACFKFKGHTSVTHSLQRHDWLERAVPQYRRMVIALEFQLFTTATR